MRSKNWQPSTSLTAVLRRVIDREKAASERRRQCVSQPEGFEPLESRLLMSSVHSAMPVVPTSFSVAVQSPTSVQLHWADKDVAAQGYYVLRSIGGASATVLSQIKSRTTTTFTDATLLPNTAATYQVQAYNTTGTSSSSAAATAITPLIAPSAPTVTVQSGTSAQLTWTGNDRTAGGYYVLRSGDGAHFSQIATVNSGATTTFTDTTLTSGHKFSYEVQAFAGSNTSAIGKVTSATTPLAAPSRLSATALTSTSVSLAWADNDASATGYYVLRSTDGTHYSQVSKIATPAATTFVDKTASSLKRFYYEIQAFSAATSSAVSEPASASTPLTVPSALTTSALTSTSVKLTWTDADVSALGYYVLRSTDGTHFSQVGQVTSGKTSTYVDSTATSNSTFQYEVQAYSGTNTSLASNVVALTTPLTAPSTLTAVAQNGTSISLHWTDNDSFATGYNLLRATDGTHFTPLATISTNNAATYTDNTVTSGHAYSYEVMAIAGNNSSALSNIAATTTPLAAPSGLSATAQTSTNILLGWTDNDASATGYNILRSTDGTHFTQLTRIASGTANSFSDNAATSLTKFYYQVQAYTGATASAASDAASATTPLTVPTGATATALSPTTVKLTWTDADTAAQGYYVLRATDDTHFSQIAQVTSGTTTTFTDTVSSNSSFQYEVEAYNGGNTSLASNVAIVSTPLGAPSVLTATAASGTRIQLNWTDNDAAATGYNVLRATGGVHFSQIGTITSADATTYTDDTVTSGHAYTYEVKAFAASVNSATSNVAVATTPLGAPSSLTATAVTGTSVSLGWTDNDSSATGYYVLRSTDGTHFTQLTKLSVDSATGYTDTAASSAQKYYYQVQAFDSATSSVVSNTANATTPMLAPTGLTTTLVGSFINLAWTNKDATATGYNVLRSDNGTDFTQLTVINSAKTTSYADTTVTGGQKYYYEVKAFNGALTSPASTIANATANGGGGTNNVTITTRYGNELVITATGTSDTVSVTQNGSTLTIVADGQSFNDPVPAAGLFVYARGGADGFTIDQSVVVHTTIMTIDGAVTDITSAATNVSAWVDSSDVFTGSGVLHAVSSFAGGVSKALGAAMKDPTDSGTITHITATLWGTGPVAGDINQGSVGDCYFLSSLAAFAGEKPSVLMESAVDMGDGTYTVQFYSAGKPVDVRVSNDMPTGGFAGFKFEHPGTSGATWGLVMEKAFAYFRTGANTYASISSGWMGEVYADLGVNSTNFFPTNYSESAFYNMLSADLAAGKAVTLGTSTAPNLVSGHAYTLISASIDGNGVTHYVVRNPWGVSGDSLENSLGYATLTFAQMKANFVDGCQAA